MSLSSAHLLNAHSLSWLQQLQQHPCATHLFKHVHLLVELGYEIALPLQVQPA